MPSPERSDAIDVSARSLAPASRGTRAMMLALIQASRGIPLNDLRTSLGVGWATTYSHLSALEIAGEVRVVHAGRRRIVAPARGPDNEARLRAAGLLRGRSVRTLALLISRREATDVAGLAVRSGLGRRAVCYHIRRLFQAGLIESYSRTRYHALRPTRLLMSLVEQTEASSPALGERGRKTSDLSIAGASS